MDLTVIGFIIGAVALVLQLSDAFPEHRETRKSIVMISIGMFIGILASAFLGAQYQIAGNVDRSFALLYGLAGAGLLCVLLAIFVSDPDRRDVAGVAAVSFGLIFLATGLVVAMGNTDGPGPSYAYSVDEVAALAERAEKLRAYDTAIERLSELSERAETTETRDAISKRLAYVRNLQFGLFKPTEAPAPALVLPPKNEANLLRTDLKEPAAQVQPLQGGQIRR